jgi:hypothetical protein
MNFVCYVLYLDSQYSVEQPMIFSIHTVPIISLAWVQSSVQEFQHREGIDIVKFGIVTGTLLIYFLFYILLGIVKDA